MANEEEEGQQVATAERAVSPNEEFRDSKEDTAAEAVALVVDKRNALKLKDETGKLDSSSGECMSGDDQTQNGHSSGAGSKGQQQQKDDSNDEDTPGGTVNTANGTRRTDGSSDKDCNTTTNLEKSPQQTENQSKDSKPKLARPETNEPCPRCQSADTKFCYFNNYNPKQPRFFCKTCQRYWTSGGTLRNVAPGAGRRKSKSAAAKEAEKSVVTAEMLAKQSNFPMPAAAVAAPFLPAAYTSALLADPMLAYSAQQQQQQQLLSGFKLPMPGAAQPWGDLGSAAAAGGALGGFDPRLLGAPCDPLFGAGMLAGGNAAAKMGHMGLPAMDDPASLEGRRLLLKAADGSAVTPTAASPAVNPMLALLANNNASGATGGACANGGTGAGGDSPLQQRSDSRSQQQQQQQGAHQQQGFDQFNLQGAWQGGQQGSNGPASNLLELHQQQHQQQQASVAALAAAASQHQQNQQVLQLQAAQLQAAAAAGSAANQWGPGAANPATNGLLNPYWQLGASAALPGNAASQWPYNYPNYQNQAMSFMTQQLLASGARQPAGPAAAAAALGSAAGLSGSASVAGGMGMQDSGMGGGMAGGMGGLPWGNFNPSVGGGLNPQQLAMLQQLNNGGGGMGGGMGSGSGEAASLLGKHARS